MAATNGTMQKYLHISKFSHISDDDHHHTDATYIQYYNLTVWLNDRPWKLHSIPHLISRFCSKCRNTPLIRDIKMRQLKINLFRRCTPLSCSRPQNAPATIQGTRLCKIDRLWSLYELSLIEGFFLYDFLCCEMFRDNFCVIDVPCDHKTSRTLE